MPPTETVEPDGQKIRALRTRKAGLGTGEFAGLVRCNRDYVCQIESGRVTRISAALYSRICNALDVEWGELLAKSTPPNPAQVGP